MKVNVSRFIVSFLYTVVAKSVREHRDLKYKIIFHQKIPRRGGCREHSNLIHTRKYAHVFALLKFQLTLLDSASHDK